MAILYNNENVNRPASRYVSGPKKGEVRYKITRSKATALEPTAAVVRAPPTFSEFNSHVTVSKLHKVLAIFSFAYLLLSSPLAIQNNSYV